MKNRLIKIVLITVFLSFTNICKSQIKTEHLIKNLEDYIENKNIPGLSVSIVKADSIIFVGGIGYANIENNEKVTKEHIFRQGSISKSFTALGLYKLLKESSYTFDSKLRDIDKKIPFSNKWENDFPVKVSHLLEHTSGFEDFHLHAIYNNKDTIMPPVMNMVNDHQQSLKVRWMPGSRKAYSNPNYIVAGHLIEKLSGNTYSNYIYENVLLPIGMKSSGFHFLEPKNKSFAQGYQRTGTKLNPIPFASINGGPAGDFCANAEDMATYLQFMLKRDSILFTKKEFDRIEIPQTSIVAKKGMPFGYGFGNYAIWKNGYLFHGHGGQIDGFTSRYLYSRDADLGIAVAINRNGNANAIVDEILDFSIGKEKSAPIERVTYEIPESLKEIFTGFYEFKSPKNQLLALPSERMFAGYIIDFKNDMLIRKRILGRPKDTLYYAGDNQFYLNNEGVPSAMLIESTNGKPAFWINDSYTEKESRTKRLVILFGLLISFLLLSSFFIYSLIWLIRNLISKKKKNAIDHLVLFGAGFSITLMFVGFGLTVQNIQWAMNIRLSSLLFLVSSYSLVVLSLVSIYRWNKLSKSKSFRIYYIATSIGTLMISIYLIDTGFIGLKLWSY